MSTLGLAPTSMEVTLEQVRPGGGGGILGVSLRYLYCAKYMPAHAHPTSHSSHAVPPDGRTADRSGPPHLDFLSVRRRDGGSTKMRYMPFMCNAFVSLDPEYWDGKRDEDETSRHLRRSPPSPQGRDPSDRGIGSLFCWHKGNSEVVGAIHALGPLFTLRGKRFVLGEQEVRARPDKSMAKLAKRR
jgi:hypothetical protein